MDTKSWTKINLEYKTGLSTVGNARFSMICFCAYHNSQT